MDLSSLLFFVSKLNENWWPLPLIERLLFFTFGWYSYFLIALKAELAISELAILQARVSYISKFSTSLLKFLLKISASSIFLLIILLLLFKITNFLWKAFSEKRRTTVFQNFLLLETTLWSSFPKKTSFSFAEQVSQKLLWRLKRYLDSLFLVFKNLFLSFDLFTIAFLSSLIIKLQFFESIYFIFLERACQEQITQCH